MNSFQNTITIALKIFPGLSQEIRCEIRPELANELLQNIHKEFLHKLYQKFQEILEITAVALQGLMYPGISF